MDWRSIGSSFFVSALSGAVAGAMMLSAIQTDISWIKEALHSIDSRLTRLEQQTIAEVYPWNKQ